MARIKIDTDKALLDVDFIHRFISNSYWGKGRTLDETNILINNSLNFGVYLNSIQIGYARVVTDFAQFAYLMDVFIAEDQRKKGFSKELIDSIMKHDLLKNIKTWRLATSDAHELYRKFGFQPLSKPENLMEKIN
jgi:N-acetylglutamate synthase-like GNAT family acetyltransferase